MLNVCGGDSHWRAEEEGEVEKTMKKELKTSSSGSEMESWVPLIGSGEEEREKGRGERVMGERTW